MSELWRINLRDRTMKMSEQWSKETILLLEEAIKNEKQRGKASHINWALKHGYEFGVICTNCLWQGRHDEYEATSDIPFICPNCDVSEHFTEFMVPSKRRFRFLEVAKNYPISINLSNSERRLEFDYYF